MGKKIPETLYMPEPNSGCFIWMGSIGGRGYGKYGDTSAHRVMYEQQVGRIPDGLVVDHLCRNILCVNPTHLEPVTPKENTLRGEGFTAKNLRKSHCVNGHALDENNTRKQPRDGGIRRACKTCQLESMRRYRARKVLSQGGGG